VPADLVILGLGIKPESGLAKDAGLEIGHLGGIRVNEYLQTNEPNIYAVGDAIEVKDPVSGTLGIVPLAGPANRQGRQVADHIFGLKVAYQGTIGTAVIRLFNLTAACTGANEKTLTRVGIPYEVVHLHPGSHAGYYPGAQPIALKVIFEPSNGQLLGAQAVGRDGVDKRIDVLATALTAGLTVHDLAELELAYAPPFGSAKDPVNLAGMAAQNVVNGLIKVAQWSEIESLDPATTVLLDVRSPEECARGEIPGSIKIPLDQLRERLGELPRDREIIVHCQSGQRSYFACRLLMQHDFNVRNLTGAYRTWNAARSL
jgi:rhodanese-related sulfurtransferase